MAPMVIGLFPAGEQAAQAMHELSSIGVRAEEIMALSAPAEEGERAAEVGGPSPLSAGVAGALDEAGLDEGQARAYAEAVARGGALLIIAPGEVPAANVKAVLMSNGAIEVEGTPAQAPLPIAPDALEEPGEGPPRLSVPEVAPPADGYRVADDRPKGPGRAAGEAPDTGGAIL